MAVSDADTVTDFCHGLPLLVPRDEKLAAVSTCAAYVYSLGRSFWNRFMNLHPAPAGCNTTRNTC